MRVSLRSIAPLLLALFATSCATPDHGLSSYVGTAPLRVRHTTLPDASFYIEVLGNRFASTDMLEQNFEKKATELCGAEPDALKVRRGRRFPDAQLPEIRHEMCRAGKFCNANEAGLPLVYGQAWCRRDETKNPEIQK